MKYEDGRVLQVCVFPLDADPSTGSGQRKTRGAHRTFSTYDRWLPSPPRVTKVQLPTLYLRNLDKASSCATVEQEAASATAEDLCPHPPPRAGNRSLTIRDHRFVAENGSLGDRQLTWLVLPEVPGGRKNPIVTVAIKEDACKPLGLNTMPGNSL